MLAVPIFLPLPGLIDPKPEPGELPAELPMGHVSTRARFREPTSLAPNQAIRLRQASEPPLSYNPAASQAEFLWYSRPMAWATRGGLVRPGSVLCARQHRTRSQARIKRTDSWHARPSIAVYPEDEEAVYPCPYCDAVYERDCDYDYD